MRAERTATAGRFLRPVEGLEPGDHACLVYDDEDRRDDALLDFLAHGLARGDRILYLARDPHDPVVARLRDRGAAAQLAVVPADDCYLHDGAFDPDRALAGLRAALDEAAALGYSTVRSAGGPPPAVTENGGAELLPGYERRARDLFVDDRMVSVCSYDVRRVPTTTLLAIIDAHPVVLYALGDDDRLRIHLAGEASLAPAGWLDVTTLGGLAGPLGRAVASGDDVWIDLRDVDFLDVAALRLLAEAARTLRLRGRRLTLAHAPSPVPAMLRLLGYDEEEGLALQ